MLSSVALLGVLSYLENNNVSISELIDTVLFLQDNDNELFTGAIKDLSTKYTRLLASFKNHPLFQDATKDWAHALVQEDFRYDVFVLTHKTSGWQGNALHAEFSQFDTMSVDKLCQTAAEKAPRLWTAIQWAEESLRNRKIMPICLIALATLCFLG